MRLILVRHGETQDNAADIIQGQTHGQLTDVGRAQAELAGIKLKNTRIDAIYTSDLKRVKDTAAVIADQLPGISQTQDVRLREQDFGIFEGRPIIELLKVMRKQEEDFASFVPVGGEGRIDFQARIVEFFNEIWKKHRLNPAQKWSQENTATEVLGRTFNTVLVVTHYGVINILIGWLLSYDHPRSMDWQIANGSLTILDIDETGRAKPYVLNNFERAGDQAKNPFKPITIGECG
jgi:broad specificity phosphatase PhoE